MQNLAEPAERRLEKTLSEVSPLADEQEPLLMSQDLAQLGPGPETPVAALPKKVTVMRLIAVSRCPSCGFLVKVWCVKPCRTSSCVVKAVWCNPMKISAAFSPSKSILPSKPCVPLAAQQPGLCLCCRELFYGRKSHI